VRSLPALVGACLAAGSLAAQAQALDLGRLFYTPGERAAMDRTRHTPPPPPRVEKPVVAPAPAEQAPSFETLNGYVSRSSGHSTTWVNGVPQNDRLQLAPSGVRVEAGTKHPIDLRVGESVERYSGERRDVLGNGNVSVGR
jgi:hypothetical protein